MEHVLEIHIVILGAKQAVGVQSGRKEEGMHKHPREEGPSELLWECSQWRLWFVGKNE